MRLFGKRDIKIVSILVVFALLICIPLSFADDQNEKYNVYDDTGTLSKDQVNDLEDRIRNFVETYQLDLVFLFTDNYKSSYNAASLSDMCKLFYQEHECGYGSEKSGIIIGVDKEKGEYDYKIYGSLPEGLKKEAVSIILDSVLSEYRYHFHDMYRGIADTVDLFDAALSKREVKLFDFADLLTDSEEEAIRGRIAKFRDQYQMDLVYFTTDSVYFNGEFHLFLKDTYDYLNFGYKDSNDGVMFGLDMNTRSYETITNGAAQDKIPWQKIGKYEERFVESLRVGNYKKAINEHIDLMEYIVTGQYLDEERLSMMIIGILISLAAALLITVAAAFSQRIVTRRIAATEYIVPGSFRLTRNSDVYSHTTITKTKKSSESSGSGSGGTSRGSSGSSYGHSGGKF